MNKKIMLVANSAFTILNFRKELIESLVENGAKVFVACPDVCSVNKQLDVEKVFSNLSVTFLPIELERNGINPFKDFLYFLKLRLLIDEVAPDVILNYTIKPLLYGSLASFFSKKKRIKVASNVTGVGYLFVSESFKSKFILSVLRPFLRMALRQNNVVFFQNSDDFKLYSDLNLLSKGVTTTILNGSGVNLVNFSPRDDAYDKLNFIFVGRLVKDKGIFEFLSAAKEVKSNYDVTFTVVGGLDSNPESLSQEELAKLKESNVIDYKGSVDSVYPLLKKNSVLILPSYREGTPRSVLEALACGLPVITTDAPGCRETVKNNVNGFLVPVQSTSDIVNKCLFFIENPEKVVEFGIVSRKLAVDKYDVNMVNKVILKYVLE